MKVEKNQTVWPQQSFKKDKRCHILIIFPVLGNLTHLGIAGSFGALLVGWLVVVARGPYFARHLFTLLHYLGLVFVPFVVCMMLTFIHIEIRDPINCLFCLTALSAQQCRPHQSSSF